MTIRFCFVSSHISNFARLLYFQAMMKSWAAQSETFHQLIVVLSGSNLTLLEKAIAFLEDMKLSKMMTIVMQVGSQFEKVALAVNKLSELFQFQPDDWIMFSDDDDLWHPDRVKVFNNAIKYATNVWDGVEKVFIPRASEINKLDPLPEQERIKAEKVVLPQQVTDGMDGKFVNLHGIHFNLWSCAVRFSVLDHFVKKSRQNLLEHKYCDLAFKYYLMTSPNFLRMFIAFPQYWEAIGLDESNWMYFFRLNKDCDQVCLQKSQCISYELSRESYEAALKNIRVELTGHKGNKSINSFMLVNECVDEVEKMLPFMFEKMEIEYLDNQTQSVSFDKYIQLYLSQMKNNTKAKRFCMDHIMSKLSKEVYSSFALAHTYLLTLRPPQDPRELKLNEKVKTADGQVYEVAEMFRRCNMLDSMLPYDPTYTPETRMEVVC